MVNNRLPYQILVFKPREREVGTSEEIARNHSRRRGPIPDRMMMMIIRVQQPQMGLFYQPITTLNICNRAMETGTDVLHLKNE
jgi:hypothetical protein